MAPDTLDPDLADLLGLDSGPSGPVAPQPQPAGTADDQSPYTAIISGAQLADILDLTPQQIGNLKRGGILSPTGNPANPSYRLRESVRGYAASIRSSRRKPQNDELQAEKTRQAREAADKLALANAVTRGELVPAAEVQAKWSETLLNVRAAMLAVPARLQSSSPNLTPSDVEALDRAIRAALAGASGASHDHDA